MADIPRTNASPSVCAFCDRPRSTTRAMIKGPHGIFICDECVARCAEIFRAHRERGTNDPAFPIV